jgi:hypothetical protein
VEGEKAEQWRVLCERAAVEKDSNKLMELVEQITHLLEEKQKGLDRQTV